MMQVVFLGVGEACDERLANTSILITYQGYGNDLRHILLDCGFTVPPRFFDYLRDPDALDALWISHFHGDHFMGVPLLLLRLMEMQRTRPLYLIGHQGVQEKIEQAMELCYPNFLEKLSYPLEYQVVTSDDKLQLFDLTWSFAETDHWQYNLALCLQGSEKSVYYSGDGGPTLRCQELARHCSLLIQEGFLIDKNVHGHGNLERSLQLTSNAQASQLAIVHMQRDVRKAEELNIRERLSQITDFKAILPEPGDELEL